MVNQMGKGRGGLTSLIIILEINKGGFEVWYLMGSRHNFNFYLEAGGWYPTIWKEIGTQRFMDQQKIKGV